MHDLHICPGRLHLHEGGLCLGGDTPATAIDALRIQKAREDGFCNGYHRGLQEGYVRARYPETCHCGYCVSHGEMCLTREEKRCIKFQNGIEIKLPKEMTFDDKVTISGINITTKI